MGGRDSPFRVWLRARRDIAPTKGRPEATDDSHLPLAYPGLLEYPEDRNRAPTDSGLVGGHWTLDRRTR